MSIDKIQFPPQIKPPKSEDELLARCQLLAGTTLGQISAELGLSVPDDLQHHKGWVGSLLERVLGADAGNKPVPDFMGLSIELKTLPLNAQGLPKESTYVCSVSMRQTGELTWHESWVKKKLSHVLWVPVEAESTIPLAERFVGNAWLWRPTVEQDAVLKQDWEELMDRIVLGEQADITAKEGEYLQLRPKAANNRELSAGVSESGSYDMVNPKGFYLRTSFTRQLLPPS